MVVVTTSPGLLLAQFRLPGIDVDFLIYVIVAVIWVGSWLGAQIRQHRKNARQQQQAELSGETRSGGEAGVAVRGSSGDEPVEITILEEPGQTKRRVSPPPAASGLSAVFELESGPAVRPRPAPPQSPRPAPRPGSSAAPPPSAGRPAPAARSGRPARPELPPRPVPQRPRPVPRPVQAPRSPVVPPRERSAPPRPPVSPPLKTHPIATRPSGGGHAVLGPLDRTALRRAILWQEVLGPPVTMRPQDQQPGMSSS